MKATRKLFAAIKELVKDGYVREAKHPEFENLSIFTYTPKAEFEEIWNEKSEARLCRGLVLDTRTRRIVIPCIKKFFNYDSRFAPTIDFEIAEITKKEDGYLIQVTIDDEYGLIVTSKGSFDSKYANFARQMIEDYPSFYDVDTIWICELLHDFPGDEDTIVTKHPETKIVCWAMIDKKTCEEVKDDGPLSRMPSLFEEVRTFTPNEARKYLTNEVEGVVLRDTKTGDRVKMKTEWFFEKHRLISNCNKNTVYETLKEGKRVQDLDIPDEFMNQMISWQDEILEIYNHFAETANTYYVVTKGWSDKMLGENSGFAVPKLYADLVFMLRKGKKSSFEELIWKTVKKRIKTE